MGFIYILTCRTTNKSYIGQTKRTVQARIKDHYKAAGYKYTEGCLALNAAIRTYGVESFIHETIMECADCDLNAREIEMIAQYQTLAPMGYNLSAGGDVPLVVAEESKQRQSQNRREYYKDENLPMHVQHLKTKYGEGYVFDCKGYKKVQFCSTKLTMDQKRELIVKYAGNPIQVGGKRSKVSYVIRNGEVKVVIPNE